MKTVKIDLSQRPTQNPVSDGIGGEHAHGTIVELPDEVADALIGLKCAYPVDGSSLIAAQQAAKARADADRMAQAKAAAQRRMNLHDNLPAEVRQAVHEHGDEATEAYLEALNAAHQREAQQQQRAPQELVKRPRGRPRKHPRLDA